MTALAPVTTIMADEASRILKGCPEAIGITLQTLPSSSIPAISTSSLEVGVTALLLTRGRGF
jgi:hypothetical protein